MTVRVADDLACHHRGSTLSAVHGVGTLSIDGTSESELQERRGSLEFRAASSCLRRLRRWRTPPSWSMHEWYEEIEAETIAASVQAACDFDRARGVPWEAFLRQRIMNAALARYRREWAHAIHRISSGAIDDYEPESSKTSFPTESIVNLLQEALGQLPGSDNFLIEGIFWEGKSEAKLAVFLGISQQAVNKRKRVILRTLKRMIESIAKNDPWKDCLDDGYL